jgi:hypothetical protein
MTPSPRLAFLLLAAGLAGCAQRPPNNTTAEGQAFYACDRPALDQTADTDNLIPQIRDRERIRRECLASNQIPPLPGARYVEAPVAQPVPPQTPAPVQEIVPLPALSPTPAAAPDSQNYQPPPIVQPPPPS